MTRQVSRTLYLVRHGEATEDERALTPRGRRQADLLGERLATDPPAAIYHGPLERARQTAGRIAEHLPGIAVQECTAAGDYLPHRPARDELPPESADTFMAFLDAVPPGDDAGGAQLAARAAAMFTGPATGTQPCHELVITHNFLIGWLVRDALAAPRWRWLGLNFCHASLTVIRYRPARAPALLALNDMAHLPPELRWTGFPADLRL